MATVQYHYGLNVDFVSQYMTKQKSGYTTLRTDIQTPQQGDSIGKKKENEKKLQNLERGFVAKKNLSKNSVKKILHAVKWLDFIADEKVYTTKTGKKITWKLQMITLTLASKQIHKDKEIAKEILGKFLNEMRNNYNFKNYIWKAETTKKGRIHYHIITDADVNYYRVLYTWNRCQNYLGYIDRSQEKKGKDKQPFGVNLRKVYNKVNAANYIAKYVSKKGDKRRAIESRLYAMSFSLSKLSEFKKEAKDLAEFTYQVARQHLRGKVIRKEFSNYIAISLKRVCAFYPELMKEVLHRLKEFAGLEPSKWSNKMYAEERSMLIQTI